MALGDLEREVMTQLWAAGEPLTVRQVHERLSRDRDLAYTTVMTVLDRLAKKSVVVQEKDGRAYRYAPAQTREEMTASVMLDALTSSEGRLQGPNEGATPDMPTASRSVQKLAELDVLTIICYHGGVVQDDANGQLRRVAQELAHHVEPT